VACIVHRTETGDENAYTTNRFLDHDVSRHFGVRDCYRRRADTLVSVILALTLFMLYFNSFKTTSR
jgi:hypothetical protein